MPQAAVAPVVACEASFEKGRLRESAQAFPEHADWVAGIEDRVVDLLTPFRSFDVYHPAHHGSASIKTVLRALTGDGYGGLEIGDGATAANEFLRVMYGDASDEGRERVRRYLEEYCGLDTMAMVEITRRLAQI